MNYKSIVEAGLLLDDEDLNLTKGTYNWNIHDGYVRRGVDYIHRLILPNEDKKLVTDHINQNRMDNRRSNLRLVPRQINTRNSKDQDRDLPRGVSHSPTVGKFVAQLTLNGKHEYLGTFWTVEEAKTAYDNYMESNASLGT